MNQNGLGSATLATSPAGRTQYAAAGLLCVAFLFATLLLLPGAALPLTSIPGFIVLNQSALVMVYGITTVLLFAQFIQTRSRAVLILAAGSLYTTGVVLLQLLCFPNVLAPGLFMGKGSDSLTWLWTLWHIAPPLFVIPFALIEQAPGPAIVQRSTVARTALLTVAATAAALLASALLVVNHVTVLPKLTDGDSYVRLTTSGVGPAVLVLTVGSLGLLCWTTRLKTVLQLWLAASLFLLVLDNVITDVAAARATVGWVAGRVEALLAGCTVLAVYLLELDFMRRRAEAMAIAQETAKDAARSARDSLALALEASGLGDWELDLVTGQARRTLRHDQIFGYDTLQPSWGRAELMQHVFPEDSEQVAAAFDRAMLDGRLAFECRIQRAGDGQVRWIAAHGRTYYDPSGKPEKMAGCLMDTTERRQTAERLHQVERMQSVGQLTGGVAHDFNNLLTIITGSLEMIQRSPANADRVARFADGALTAARRGAEVTGKLLAFSRRQVVRPEVLDVNGLLDGFLPLLQRAASEEIDLRLDLDPSLRPARLDPRQFEAAVLNLVANARDAMPGGGIVAIGTRNRFLAGEEAVILDVEPGAYLSVTVRDTGCGMSATSARSAFEPFFTTKDVGKGTGLGLSQVYGFAKQAGGVATIESEPGVGTVVELLLPRSPAPIVGPVAAQVAGLVAAPVAAPAPARPALDRLPLPRATQGEVVLVVEDDLPVLELAVECLRDLGYKTLTATSAVTALDRLRSPERIDVLFSDVVMPGGMNGVQLAVLARTIRDGLKVVLASGYTASALALDHEMPVGMPLLNKPYKRDDLAQTLQTVLTQE